MQINDLIIEMRNVERVIPYFRNARKIPEVAVEKVAVSIQAYGFRQPIVVDKDGVIICGHARLAAAKRLGMAQVPVHVAENLTPEQVKAYRLADNRTHEKTTWDLGMLAVEVAELASMGVDLASTAFNGIEIDKLLAGSPEDDDRANAVPPLPEDPVTQAGDLWHLGPHKALCGDATSPEVIARVLSERKPLLMVTDPPYGIELDSEWRDRAGLNGCGPAEPSYMKKRTQVGSSAYSWAGSPSLAHCRTLPLSYSEPR